MANEELARAYAQAVFDQAVERWRKGLTAVNEAADKAGAVTRLDNPSEPFDRKKETANTLLPPNADGELRNFIYLLASRNDMHLLPEVLAEFDRYIARGPARKLAQVTSAVPLTDQERAQLEQKLHARFGKDLDVEYREDKGLLGGVVVRVGDLIVDGSVSGKLAAMRQKLEAGR